MACLKVSFANRSEAERSLGAGGPRRPYKCKHCDYWHLTILSTRELKQAKKGRVKPHRPRPGLVERPVNQPGVDAPDPTRRDSPPAAQR